ncbi:MAG TPA: beta-N-acetylglucosaminidase domain-containing protein [Archangium sp.]|nr:beta-N-acetylglucosaminidase domain-containing protein [Archangium sp.]
MLRNKFIAAVASFSMLVGCAEEDVSEEQRGSTESELNGMSTPVHPQLRYGNLNPAMTNINATRNGCVDAAAVPDNSRLLSLAQKWFNEAGLNYVAVGASCNIKFTFLSTKPPLSTTGDSTWTAAGSNSHRYIVKSNADASGNPFVELHAPTGARAAMYALGTAISLVRFDNGTLKLQTSEIVDHPSTLRRGVVEGFYGPVYASESRKRLIQIMARLRMNKYIYSPKDDPFTKTSWRSAYPAANGAAITAARQEAEAHHLEFYWGISPGQDFNWGNYTSELNAVKAKLDSLRNNQGVTHFALFLDDLVGADTSQHATLINDVDNYLDGINPAHELIVVGTTYHAPTNSYTNTLGSSVNSDVDIMWTGNGVSPSTITVADLSAPNTSFNRQVTIWDNWPWNPGSFTGRAADLHTAYRAYYANPVINEVNSDQQAQGVPQKPIWEFYDAIGLIADYLWLPSSYSSATSYGRWKQKYDALVPNGSPLAPSYRPERAALHNGGHLEVFYRNTSGAIESFRESSPGGSFGSFVSYAGTLAGNPVVSLNGDERLQFFVRGNDGVIYTKHQTAVGVSGSWSGWVSLGSNNMASDPTVIQNRDGRMEVFARGSDNAIWSNWQTKLNGAFSGWNSLGGGVTGRPGVGRRADGRLEVFARGTDGHIWARVQSSPGGAMNGWYQLPTTTTFAGDPFPVGSNNGSVWLFVRGSDNIIRYTRETNGTWSAWSSLSASAFVSNPAVTRTADGRIAVFVRNAAGAVTWFYQTAVDSTSFGSASLGGTLTGNLSVARTLGGQLDVYGRSSGGAIVRNRQSLASQAFSTTWTTVGGAPADF